MERVLTEEIILKESIDYNYITGDFYWKDDRPIDHFKTKSSYKRWKTMYAGKRIFNPDASCSNTTIYAKINLSGTKYKAHRVAWFLFTNRWPEGEIDHIDGNGLNNKISNLRDVSKSLNQRNTKTRENNSSGYRGVSFRKDVGKWVARGSLLVEGQHTRPYLGMYLTFDEAKTARIKWEQSQGDFTTRNIGTGVIINSQPILEPMILDTEGRWKQ